MFLLKVFDDTVEMYYYILDILNVSRKNTSFYFVIVLQFSTHPQKINKKSTKSIFLKINGFEFSSCGDLQICLNADIFTSTINETSRERQRILRGSCDKDRRL